MFITAATLSLAEGAWLKPGELSMVVSDFNADLSFVSAHGQTAWLIQTPVSMFASGDYSAAASAPPWFLLCGNEALHPTLQAALPVPSTRRTLPKMLRGKEFSGGSLQLRGYNKHLIPVSLCVLVPASERLFVWWDDETEALRVVPEVNGHCYPLPSGEHRFSLKFGMERPLMMVLSPEGHLMLMSHALRDVWARIDLEVYQLTAEGVRTYVVSRDVRSLASSAGAWRCGSTSSRCHKGSRRGFSGLIKDESENEASTSQGSPASHVPSGFTATGFTATGFTADQRSHSTLSSVSRCISSR